MIDFSQFPEVAPEYDLADLLEAGCHFGHDVSAWHPNMAEWIYAKQKGIHIFDLEKTARQLRLAYNYIYQLGKENKSIIFVGTKRQAREVVKAQAQEAGAHWITSRWLGGLLTNWKQIRKSLQRMIEIEEGLEGDKFEIYTKYEQTQLEKEAGRLARFFDGLRGLKDIPDAIMVIDPQKESIAVDEAKMVGVPVIGLVDSNTDPQELDLVIPANDDGRSSIDLIITALTAAYAAGKKAGQGSKTPAKPKTAAKPNKAQAATKEAEKKAALKQKKE